MSVSVSIGQRFTQLIQHLGLSKNAFAQSLDKTATVIQHLVDERNKPGYDLLCKVFEVYPNVSKDWLMEGAGPMMKSDVIPASPVPPAAAVPSAAGLFAAPVPVAAPPQVPAEAPASAPVAVSLQAPTAPVIAPATEASPAPVPVVALVAPAASAVVPAVASPAPVPVVSPTPDPAYLTAALQTQYLQHQLALAEQRNQHLLEQQALMQQLLAVLQGR